MRSSCVLVAQIKPASDGLKRTDIQCLVLDWALFQLLEFTTRGAKPVVASGIAEGELNAGVRMHTTPALGERKLPVSGWDAPEGVTVILILLDGSVSPVPVLDDECQDRVVNRLA